MAEESMRMNCCVNDRQGKRLRDLTNSSCDKRTESYIFLTLSRYTRTILELWTVVASANLFAQVGKNLF